MSVQVTTPQAPSAAPARSSLKRRAAVGLAAAALLSTGAVVAGPASPAAAATGVSFCFKWSTGAAYAYNPVYLYAWNGSGWSSVRSGKTNGAGCGTFYSTDATRYYQVQAYMTTGDANVSIKKYSGWTPYYVGPGSGTVNLGTGTVYYVSCTKGLYVNAC